MTTKKYTNKHYFSSTDSDSDGDSKSHAIKKKIVRDVSTSMHFVAGILVKC